MILENPCFSAVQGLSVCLRKYKTYKTTILPDIMGVKLGLLLRQNGTDWKCLRKGWSGDFSDLRGANLHSEKLHNFCHSPNIVNDIKQNKSDWRVIHAHGESKNPHKILVGKPEGKNSRWRSLVRVILRLFKIILRLAFLFVPFYSASYYRNLILSCEFSFAHLFFRLSGLNLKF